jgi:SAM-dependent methyltransferase
MGRQAQGRILKQAYQPRLCHGYAQNLPFPTAIFDQIVVTFPTEYIYTQETLSEVYRVLKPSGTLVALPAAWITGKSPIDRGTATLFRVTGQAPRWDPQWLTPFKQAGFQVQAEMIHQKSWSLVIILANKQSQRPSSTANPKI